MSFYFTLFFNLSLHSNFDFLIHCMHSGLGKTLQSIATLYTLMKQGKRGPDAPIVKRCIVVCPCSLVNNWAQEFEKWVNCRVKTEAEKVRALPMSATDKKSVLFAIAQFLHVSHPYDVLIISYETFRLYATKFTKKNDTCCDLLICDVRSPLIQCLSVSFSSGLILLGSASFKKSRRHNNGSSCFTCV